MNVESKINNNFVTEKYIGIVPPSLVIKEPKYVME